MRVFISWSGQRSKVVAESLGRWLPRIINAVEPWVSTLLEKGTRSTEEIAEALESTRFGVICLTRDNLESKWIHFEAGALSKAKGARVWTLLYDISPADIEAPLSQFQHTILAVEDMRKLVHDINGAVQESGERSLAAQVLDEQFADLWPKLVEAMKNVPPLNGGPETPARSERDILEEILQLVRDQRRPSRLAMAREIMRPIRIRVPSEQREQAADFLTEMHGRRLLTYFTESASEPGSSDFLILARPVRPRQLVAISTLDLLRALHSKGVTGATVVAEVPRYAALSDDDELQEHS